MKSLLVALALAGAALTPAIVHAQAAASSSSAAAAKPYYSTADSTIGDLLDNPDTKAVLAKYLPEMTANPDQMDQARGLTLRACQQYAPDKLPDDLLAKIDGDLAKIPAPKK